MLEIILLIVFFKINQIEWIRVLLYLEYNIINLDFDQSEILTRSHHNEEKRRQAITGDNIKNILTKVEIYGAVTRGREKEYQEFIFIFIVEFITANVVKHSFLIFRRPFVTAKPFIGPTLAANTLCCTNRTIKWMDKGYLHFMRCRDKFFPDVFGADNRKLILRNDNLFSSFAKRCRVTFLVYFRL